ncbi:MAG TPA: branched-chain amino acid ABC transporter permease [Syntrophorhabdaceae bacterium]|nr:branched-chain amino acid ABC transporter permease [Syntrophorhabdaceae bacterium]HPP06637.1 branched-chain amino acid ABC transporter permease [Syntrophorhabdaceae bacterium]
MEILIYGIINSVTLAIISLGFTLVYSISRLPNFAHGALYITTGYITWLFLNRFEGFPYPFAIFLGIGITCIIGALIYRLIVIRIRGMEISEIIATYAIGLAILEGLRWGGLRGMTFTLPVFYPGSVEIFGVSVDYQRIIIVIVGICTFILLYLFTHFNKIGLALRGIAQDERAAMMLGIDSDMTAIISLAIGSGLAGFAAILLLPLGNIIVEAGYNVLIFAIAVCVIGGLGSWAGTVLASFIIGFAQILTEHFLSSHYQMVVALLAIIATLLIKPSGIFGKQKELEERV